MIQTLGFGNIGFGEMAMIGAVILLLFGAKKIPELMRSLGSGMREFKRGVQEGALEENPPPPPDPKTPA